MPFLADRDDGKAFEDLYPGVWQTISQILGKSY